MNILFKALTEIWGLFVDDGPFAAALVVWCAVAWRILPDMAVGRAWGGPILFIGCVAILVVAVLSSAKRRGLASSSTKAL